MLRHAADPDLYLHPSMFFSSFYTKVCVHIDIGCQGLNMSRLCTAIQIVYISSYAANITVCNTLLLNCSIQLLKVVYAFFWNRACSYSKRQIVFVFLVLTNQRPGFGRRQLYTFKHVFIVKQAIEHTRKRVFFILVICKCNAASIIRDLIPLCS